MSKSKKEINTDIETKVTDMVEPVEADTNIVKEKKESGIATASMVLGILSFFIPGMANLLAIIFGGVGLKKTEKGTKDRGEAKAGLACGIIVTIIWIIIIAAAVFGISYLINSGALQDGFSAIISTITGEVLNTMAG